MKKRVWQALIYIIRQVESRVNSMPSSSTVAWALALLLGTQSVLSRVAFLTIDERHKKESNSSRMRF